MADETANPEGSALEEIRRAVVSFGAAIQDMMVEIAALRMTLIDQGLISEAEVEKSRSLLRRKTATGNRQSDGEKPN